MQNKGFVKVFAGKEIYRITLKTEEKKVTGKYGFVIQQVK